MEIVEIITLDQIRALKPKTIFYGANTCWWTHDPLHLGRPAPPSEERIKRFAETLKLNARPGMFSDEQFLERARKAMSEGGPPCDPSGGMLFETDYVEAFLNAAILAENHYGKHGLRAFVAAHHQNSIHDIGDPRPWCHPSWDAYNDAIDRADARGEAQVLLTESARNYQLMLAKKSELESAIADDGKIVARCVTCSGEFTSSQTRGKSGCPACGNPGLPMSPDDDVEVKINWHELRILTIWAENYAGSIKGKPDVKGDPVQTIFAIAKRIQDQFPFRNPLTLSAEMELVKREFAGVEVHGVEPGGPIPGGEEQVG